MRRVDVSLTWLTMTNPKDTIRLLIEGIGVRDYYTMVPQTGLNALCELALCVCEIYHAKDADAKAAAVTRLLDYYPAFEKVMEDNHASDR